MKGGKQEESGQVRTTLGGRSVRALFVLRRYRIEGIRYRAGVGAMTWAFVDFYLATWPGPVENLAEIATKVITSAFECIEWRPVWAWYRPCRASDEAERCAGSFDGASPWDRQPAYDRGAVAGRRPYLERAAERREPVLDPLQAGAIAVARGIEAPTVISYLEGELSV